MTWRLEASLANAGLASAATTTPAKGSSGWSIWSILARIFSCFKKATPPSPVSVPASPAIQPERVQAAAAGPVPSGFGRYLGRGRWENENYQPPVTRQAPGTQIFYHDHILVVRDDGTAQDRGRAV